MTRLVVIVALALIAYRMLLGRWPWQKTLDASMRSRAKAQRLLGVSARAGRGDIIAAHKRRLAAVHPDRGGSAAGVYEANEARDLLLAHLPPSDFNDLDPKPDYDPKEPS